MSIKDLRDINWETVTVDDLTKAHELRGMDFEVDNGRITKVYYLEEVLKE